MRSFSLSSEAPANAGAFLLPWQLLALAWLCGIWATRFPLPGLFAGIILGIAGVLHTCRINYRFSLSRQPREADHGNLHSAIRKHGPLLIFPTLLVVSLLAGYSAAFQPAPHEETRTPAFIAHRETVLISGTVVEVDPVAEGRLHVILDNIQCRIAQSSARSDDRNPENETSDINVATGERDSTGTDTNDVAGTVNLPGRMVWTWEHPEPVSGIESGYRIGPGQRVTLKQRVKSVRGFLNRGTWDSGQYWRDKGVLWRVWSRGSRFGLAVSGTPDTIWQWRERLRSQLMRVLENSPSLLPEPGNAAATIPALLFGDRFSLTYDRMDQLALASISHSLALSGMHLGVVSGLGWGLAWLIGWFVPAIYLHIPRPKLAVLLAAPMVGTYVWLGGASPSLIRAALMFACWGILLWRDRPRVLLDGVFMAVCLITLHSPNALFDLRLQLSALAVLSLALFLPWIEHLVQRLSPPRSTGSRAATPLHHRLYTRTRTALAGLLAANICIQLGMLPVVIWNFNGSSLWFPLNLLWLPVLGLWVLPACLAGFALCLMALLLSSAAGIFTGLATGVFSAAIVPVSGLFHALDWLQQSGWLLPNPALRPHWLEMAGYWCILVASAALFAKRRPLATLGMGLGACLLCFPLAGRMIHATDGHITLTMLDVGQGQSLLITLPREHRILIDGGGFGISGFDTGKSIVTPALTWHMPPKLDVIVNTHPDTDHLQGLLYPLRHFGVQRYAGNGKTASKANEAHLQQVLRLSGITQENAVKGDILYRQDNITLEVLHPGADINHASSNNAALVLRLVRTDHGIRHGLALIMGDLEKQGIRALLKSGSDLSADVLILPHHGARSSFEPALYDAVRPIMALSATGYLNQWNFPSDEVRAALAERTIPLYDTAQNGQVQVEWPGPVSTSDSAAEAGPRVSVMQGTAAGSSPAK